MTVTVGLLGTFHFHDVEPRVMSDVGQREIADVVERSLAFAPTKVAVEVPVEDDDITSSGYRAWRDIGGALPANESVQLGYRVASAFAHDRLHPVDLMWRFYDDDVERLRAADPSAQSRWDALLAYIATAAREIVDLLDAGTILDALRFINSGEQRHRTLAVYYEHLLLLADDEGSPGPTMIANWYDRNIRIAANIARIADDGDRILVIYGSGHIPLLEHAFDLMPGYVLEDLRPFIGV